MLLACPADEETGALDAGYAGSSEVVVQPAEPTTADVLTADYTPPTGAEVRWQWFRDNLLDETHTSALVPPDATARDQVWRVVVTPMDGETPIGQPLTGKVVIGNTPPEITDLALSEGPTVVSGVQATVQASDADGDTIAMSYRWTLDGIEDLSFLGPSLPAGAASRDVEVTAVVTPDDGDLVGASAQAVVTIDNSPPSVAAATLSYKDPTPMGSVTVTPSGWYDADGDAEGYAWRWHVNGAPVIDDEITDTLPLQGRSPGDVVYCEITPTDGIDDGVAVLSDTMVVDAPP